MASASFPSFLLVLPFALLVLCTCSAAGGAKPRDICSAGNGRSAVAAASCNIQCFRADPVCGVNGVTYTCGCPEAACNGVAVVKRGHC